MAREWVKMRSALLTNPKVIRMTRYLLECPEFIEWWTRGTEISCNDLRDVCDVTVVTRVTLASLMCVWSAANEALHDGENIIRGATLFEIDAMAGAPGIGAAMELVGWVVVSADGVYLPNFQEFNTPQSSRAEPMTGAQRTARWRRKKQGCDESDESDENVTRCDAEKRREEFSLIRSDAAMPDGAGGNPVRGKVREFKPEDSVFRSFDSMPDSILADQPAMLDWIDFQAKMPNPVIPNPTVEDRKRILAIGLQCLSNGVKKPKGKFITMVTKNLDPKPEFLRKVKL